MSFRPNSFCGPNSNFGFKIEIWFEKKNENLGPKFKNSNSDRKSYFCSRIEFSIHQKNGRKLKKKLTLLLKNSILSGCKGDSFLLSLHFFNLFFTIFFFFNCFCFLNKFIVIFLKNAVRYLSTIYRVQNGAKKQKSKLTLKRFLRRR